MIGGAVLGLCGVAWAAPAVPTTRVPQVTVKSHPAIAPYCTREMTCESERCVPTATLSDDILVGLVGAHAEAGGNVVVQFWGDSVTAQAECDFRSVFGLSGCKATPLLQLEKRRRPKFGAAFKGAGARIPSIRPGDAWPENHGEVQGRCVNPKRREFLPDAPTKSTRAQPMCPDLYSATFSGGPLRNGTTVTSMYYQIGCPWYCNSETDHDPLAEKRSVDEIVSMANNDLWNASVIVFNLGSHYTNAHHFEKALQVYGRALQRVIVDHIIIRSPQATHFATDGGSFDKKAYLTNRNSVDCRPRLLQGGVEAAQDTVLRTFARKLAGSTTARVSYIDVLELSNYHTMHPQYHFNLVVRDCRHVCQNCKLLRTWSSLVASTLAGGKSGETTPAPELAAHISVPAPLL